MKLLSVSITFLFISLWCNPAFALPGEGEETKDPIIQNGKLFTPDQVASAARAQRKMAEVVCAGKSEDVVSYQLKNLMKVGLYNYCDQYKDDERFCRCVSEVTYENKLSDEDIKTFKEGLIADSKKNIALNSFKVLKEYKQENLRNIANKPLDLNTMKKLDSYSFNTCDGTHKLKTALSPYCSESDLLELKKSFSLALEECEDCEGMDIDNMPKDFSIRGQRTSGEDFLEFPQYWLSNQFIKQAKEDEFKVEEINKKYTSNSSKFKSIGDFQYKDIIENLASRIKKSWDDNDNNSETFSYQSTKEKRKDLALIVLINEHYLFKKLKGLPKQSFLYDSKKLKKDHDAYVDFFASKIPQSIFDRKSMSKTTIATLLESFLEEKHRESLDDKCRNLVKVFKTSCEEISKDNISFNFDEEVASSLRDKKYKINDKFKFDQLYCVEKNKVSTNLGISYLNNINFGKVGDILNRGKSSKNLFKKNLLSLTDGYLNIANFSSGASIDITGTLQSGGENFLIDVLLDDDEEEVGNLDFNVVKSGESNYSYDPFANENLKIVSTPSGEFKVVETKKGSFNQSARNQIILDDMLTRAIDSDKELAINSIREDIAKINERDSKASKISPDDEVKKSEVVDDNSINIKGNNKVLSDNEKFIAKEVDVSESYKSKSPTGENFGELPQDFNNISFSGRNFNTRNSQISDLNSSRFQREISDEEIMQARIKELEEKLTVNKPSGAAISEEATSAINPTKNSFANSDEPEEDNLELNKLKVELEKMKLQMAKSELEAKKKEPVAKKVTSTSSVNNLSVSNNLSPLERASTKGVVNTNTKRKSEKPANRSSASSVSQSRAESTSSSPTSSQSEVSSSSVASDPTASRSSSVASRSNRNGALLTATQVGDSQFSTPEASTEVSYQNFSEISSAGQNELEKLYSEFGTQLVTQAGTEVLLEKDEETGEIKVIEKESSSDEVVKKALSKRAPASTEKSAEEKKSRKRFSLQEFNQIIDEGVKEE
ncbi:hypothetical protein [Halobacteriovorax sp.]|uniref:hypothetical protein n=1 Tax=Halobacteriovorax sp. TaxID=2020862 RepID=UPI003562D549